MKKKKIIKDLECIKGQIESQDERNKSWDVDLSGVVYSIEILIDEYKQIECEED